MSDINLRQQLLDFFHLNYNNDVKLIDICRAVQQPKKAVNSILYSLRNEGVLQKVVESPPVWRVSEKLFDKYSRPPGAVRLVPIQYSIKKETLLSPVSANNNVAVLPAAENSLSETTYAKDELVAYHPVMNGVSADDTQQQQQQAYNGRVTAQQAPMPIEIATGPMSNAAYLSKPAESILSILHKQKGPLSCKAISSLSGFPEAIVKLTLSHLLFLGLVFQDNYEMYWSSINRNSAQPQDIVVSIINYLKQAKTAVHTKELVRGVGLNNKKEINPLLYKLQQKGVVMKVNESPPMWQLAEQVANNIAEEPSREAETSHLPENHFRSSNPLTAYAAGDFKPVAPTAAQYPNNLVHQNIQKSLPVKQQMHFEESSPIVESPPEDNADEYPASRKSNANYAPQEKPTKPRQCEAFEVVEKADTPSTSPQEVTEILSTVQISNCNKVAETKSRNTPVSLCQSPAETDTSANSARLVNGQNTKQISSDGSSRNNRKSGNSAKGSSKSPEQNSAAHYVNDVLNSDSFAALMKNPVSALYEYGQRNHIDTKVEITLSEGPPHNPRFKAVAYMGDEELAAAWDKTKKDARRQAAELAVRGLVANGGFGKFSSLSTNAETINELPPVVSQFDMIAALCHKTFNERVLQVPEYMGGRKVLAALVMKKGTEDSRGTVICLGTGNRCITGEGLSQDGLVVNDSHAEVITRRGFLRFLYKQLQTYDHNKDHPIFEPIEGKLLQVKPDVTFHLYISTAPCGDGALFTHNLKPGEKVEPPDNDDGVHHPVFTKSLQGLLRSKMEAGEGTIPIDTQYRFQSWDAILRGEKLRTMSCSDKIARWNVLGLQGALLSHVLKPIYLSSVTLGNLYHHGHLSRAVCCRLVGEPDMNELLPPDYRLNHPDLGRVNVFTPSRETEKTKPHSINWCYEDEHPELTSGVNGTSDERAGGQTQSRLCKAVIFQSFKDIAEKFGVQHFTTVTYGESKREAKQFQVAKEVLFVRFQQLGRGTWIRKPEEEEEFM